MGASDFLDKGNARKVIFTTTQSPKEAIESVGARADVVIAGTDKVDLPEVLSTLKKEYSVNKLMVEGGGTLNFALLRQGLIDEVRIKIGNLLLGGRDAPTLFDGSGFSSTDSPAVRLMRIEKHDRYSHVLIYHVLSREEADQPTGLIARTKLPTRFGEFDLLAFQDDHELKENAVLAKGELQGARRVPLRIQSECLTGDTFGSYRCDCREQLELSMNMISDFGAGLIVYLRQEGRGNGLLNKVRIYEIMDQGHDTVRATRELEIPVDARSYEFVADVIRALGIESVSLLTNSPDKTRMLTSLGIEVEGTIPVVIPPNEINEEYLKSKKELFQHAL
jgi:GTP cyclohydrolase II